MKCFGNYLHLLKDNLTELNSVLRLEILELLQCMFIRNLGMLNMVGSRLKLVLTTDPTIPKNIIPFKSGQKLLKNNL